MRKPCLTIAVLALVVGSSLSLAQTTGRRDSSTRPTSGSDRLFLSFIEDATVVDEQWWEGQFEFTEGNQDNLIDIGLIRGVVAFQLIRDLELGGRVGFGNSDTPAPFPDGTGGTDLDLWAKYYLNTAYEKTELAIGSELTVPMGDDGAGLGNDAFGLSVFATVRHRLDAIILSGHIGARISEDGETLGRKLDGEVSPMVGFALLAPVSDELTFVAELDFEGKRFEFQNPALEYEPDARVLGGVNFHVTPRGMFRGAVAFGLSDGAPDAQLIAGYAVSF